MSMQTFLIAVRDPESAQKAVARARLMARSGDKIVLAHVTRGTLLNLLGAGQMLHAVPEQSVASLMEPTWLESVREQLETGSAEAMADVRMETVLLTGEPGVAIGEHARAIGATAIICAAPRSGMTRELFLGSTALGILRHAPCPVVVARGDGSDAYKNVALAVDADPAAKRIIAAALSLLPNSTMKLIHAYRLPNEGLLRMRGVPEPVLAMLRKNMLEDVQRHVTAMHASVPQASVSLVQGFAGSAILEVVLDQKPDVLLVSQHRGTFMEQRTIGSVTQFLLYHCPCDLMLVP